MPADRKLLFLTAPPSSPHFPQPPPPLLHLLPLTSLSSFHPPPLPPSLPLHFLRDVARNQAVVISASGYIRLRNTNVKCAHCACMYVYVYIYIYIYLHAYNLLTHIRTHSATYVVSLCRVIHSDSYTMDDT